MINQNNFNPRILFTLNCLIPIFGERCENNKMENHRKFSGETSWNSLRALMGSIADLVAAPFLTFAPISLGSSRRTSGFFAGAFIFQSTTGFFCKFHGPKGNNHHKQRLPKREKKRLKTVVVIISVCPIQIGILKKYGTTSKPLQLN